MYTCTFKRIHYSTTNQVILDTWITVPDAFLKKRELYQF